MAVFQVAESVGGLAHRILPVDNGSELTLLHEIAQNGQVCLESFGDVHLELLRDKRRHDEGFQIASYPRQLAFVLAGAAHSSQNADAVRSEHAPALGDGVVPDVIEDDIVTPIALSEVLFRVVNHVVRAHRSGLLQITRTADGGDLCAKRFGDLHRERAYASGGAVDQNLLPRRNVTVVAKTLQRGESGHSDGTRLLKRDVSGLRDQCPFRSTSILRDGSLRDTEDLITLFEFGDIFTHAFHRACAIDPEARVLWLTQSGK